MNEREFVASLPYPLAKLCERIWGSPSADGRHHNAFFLAEAALKLAVSLRVKRLLELNLVSPGSPLAKDIKTLCHASNGHWVGLLRDTARVLKACSEATLLEQKIDLEAALVTTSSSKNPVSGGRTPKETTEPVLEQEQDLPAIRAWAHRFNRNATNPGDRILAVGNEQKFSVYGFFNLVTQYRNKVMAHGWHRPPHFYEEVGPLLYEAVKEALATEGLYRKLVLAAPRQIAQAVWEWRDLRGTSLVGSYGDKIGPDAWGKERPVVQDELHFVSKEVRISLHPLVVFRPLPQMESQQVLFVNRIFFNSPKSG